MSLTARSWATRKERMSRRRGSATALKASEVVEARGMRGLYSYTGICQELFLGLRRGGAGFTTGSGQVPPGINMRQKCLGAGKIDGYVEPDCGIRCHRAAASAEENVWREGGEHDGRRRRADRGAVHDQHGHGGCGDHAAADAGAGRGGQRNCALDGERAGSGGGRAGDQEAAAGRGMQRADHRRFSLQRPRAADEISGVRGGAGQVPHQSGQRGRGPAARRTVFDDLQSGRGPRQAGAHWGEWRLAESRAGDAQDAGKHRPEPGKESEEIINDCMVLSALQSTELALESGLRNDQIIISCKTSRPRDLITVYRDLSSKTQQPLHLGLTEAGMGMKGLVWSSAALGVLLAEGIGDTIRISLTPKPGGDRREEVYACCELLQALGLRSFSPSVTACPGCGRTTSTTFQELAERIQGYVRDKMPEWKMQYEGVENMTLAVMGCIVNGPGESRAANIGISLPGTGETPTCPVYIDGQHFTTLRGAYDELAASFQTLVDDYVTTKYARREPEPAGAAGARV